MPGLSDRLRAFWAVLTAGADPATTLGGRVAGGGPRAAGPPRSSNGASSFHLFWELPPTPEAARLVEVSAVLEVVQPPRVDSLHFWALQVDFSEGGLQWGGGHTGLQWNRRFSGGTAANWGGYASQELGGAVLPGSRPGLFTFPSDPNTMAFPWEPHHPYRLCVRRSPDTPGAWRAEVTDLGDGTVTVLREIFPPDRVVAHRGSGRGADDALQSAYLLRPMVWSEVFADCDAPQVVVRWSDLFLMSESGKEMQPQAVTVNYQAHQAGGCSNTSVRIDGDGFLQLTNSPREFTQGARLDVRRSRR